MAATTQAAREKRWEDGYQFTIDTSEVEYAMVQEDKPDTKFEVCWKVNVLLDDTWSKALSEAGFNVKKNRDGKDMLVVKKKCVTRAGKKNDPPRVVDASGQKFTEAIGNGSKCQVVVFGKYMNPKNPGQVVAYLNEVKVIDHVAYNGSAYDNVGVIPF